MKSVDESVSEEVDDIKQSDDKQTEVLMEGYLQKQSLHIKQFRKRFIVLKNNHLYCYKTHEKLEMTECIDLSSYKQAIVSEKEGSQFELVPKSKRKNAARIFSADSMDDTEEWMGKINQSINPSEETSDSTRTKSDDGMYFYSQNTRGSVL